MPDISKPVRDRGHEALRQELLSAADSGRQNARGVDDSYFLTDLLFDLLGSALDQVDELTVRCDALQADSDTTRADIDAMQTDVADLTDRLAQIEAANAPLPGPDAAG